MTAKDCSIMVTLVPSIEEEEDDERWEILIGWLKLDLKSVSHLNALAGSEPKQTPHFLSELICQLPDTQELVFYFIAADLPMVNSH